jgi:YgiT-type zinc finger domain-containing protein
MPIDKVEQPIVKPCNNCQAGQMHLRYLVYFTWLADELITVPNFPAWVCDMCGAREYDSRAVNQLNLLLNPNAGKPTRRHPPARPRRSLPKGPRLNPD